MVADHWLVVKGDSLSKSIEQGAELDARCKVLGPRCPQKVRSKLSTVRT